MTLCEHCVKQCVCMHVYMCMPVHVCRGDPISLLGIQHKGACWPSNSAVKHHAQT